MKSSIWVESAVVTQWSSHLFYLVTSCLQLECLVLPMHVNCSRRIVRNVTTGLLVWDGFLCHSPEYYSENRLNRLNDGWKCTVTSEGSWFGGISHIESLKKGGRAFCSQSHPTRIEWTGWIIEERVQGKWRQRALGMGGFKNHHPLVASVSNKSQPKWTYN